MDESLKLLKEIKAILSPRGGIEDAYKIQILEQQIKRFRYEYIDTLTKIERMSKAFEKIEKAIKYNMTPKQVDDLKFQATIVRSMLEGFPI